MIRDTQKAKLYRAENTVARGIEWKTLDEIEAFLTKLVNSRRFEKRFKLQHKGNRKSPILRPGFGARRATGGFWMITLPRLARCQRVVLHELAHCVTNGAKHGPDFAKAFHDLVSMSMGRETARALRVAYKQERVRMRPKRKRVLTPERLAVLREQGKRLAELRAAAREREKDGGTTDGD